MIDFKILIKDMKKLKFCLLIYNNDLLNIDRNNKLF